MNIRVWNGKYNIQARGAEQATVSCRWFCPCCGSEAVKPLSLSPTGLGLAEQGGFYGSVHCPKCNSSAGVMFHPA